MEDRKVKSCIHDRVLRGKDDIRSTRTFTQGKVGGNVNQEGN